MTGHIVFTYCSRCGEQADCLPHEDEMLCLGPADYPYSEGGTGCWDEATDTSLDYSDLGGIGGL